MNYRTPEDPRLSEDCIQRLGARTTDATTGARSSVLEDTRTKFGHAMGQLAAPKNICADQRQVAEEDGQMLGSPRRSNDNPKRWSSNARPRSHSPRNIGDATEDTVRSGFIRRLIQVVREYGRFMGPGFMVAVAYIDPGELSFGRLVSRLSTTSAVKV